MLPLLFFNFLVTISSISILAYLISKRIVRVGSLVSVINLVPTFGGSITQYFTEKEFYNSGLKLFDERFSFIKGIHKVPSLSHMKDFIISSSNVDIKEIKLNNVSVEFERKLTFPNISFKDGKKYLIIGESGSGKSTLLKTIIGENNTYNGEIIINGIVKNKDDNLFNNISYVNQDTFLFNDTVKNIIDFNGILSDSEINNLLEKTGLKNIHSNTRLDDNGKNLSGGERQRISLLRAISRNKNILILDEATANLDNDTANIIENLAIDKSKTLIMISHRVTDDFKKRFDKVISL